MVGYPPVLVLAVPSCAIVTYLFTQFCFVVLDSDCDFSIGFVTRGGVPGLAVFDEFHCFVSHSLFPVIAVAHRDEPVAIFSQQVFCAVFPWLKRRPDFHLYHSIFTLKVSKYAQYKELARLRHLVAAFGYLV